VPGPRGRCRRRRGNADQDADHRRVRGRVRRDDVAGWRRGQEEARARSVGLLRSPARDYQDAAESWPEAVWPERAHRALRGLIKAWPDARGVRLPAVPADVKDPLIHEFRHTVLAGLAGIPRIPGPKNSTGQHPGYLLEFCKDREDDVLRFARICPTNNTSERSVRPVKTPSRRPPGG
jgi:hypothetical protein